MFKFFRKDKPKPESDQSQPAPAPAEQPRDPAQAEPPEQTAAEAPAQHPRPAFDPATQEQVPAPSPTPAPPAPEVAEMGQPPAERDLVEVPDVPSAPLEEKLDRSRGQLGGRLKALFRFRKKIDDDLMEELETLLLTSDVGADVTTEITAELTARIKRAELDDADAVLATLRDLLTEFLAPCEQELVIDPARRPFVILTVGVNGVGKTTTIGKLAKRFQDAGLSVMLAAGDTFRAAAVEQLQQWGERNKVPVVAQSTGADSASVVFDALQAAQARGIDVLIADTAGRLHTQSNLMQELAKIRRVLAKLDPSAPHEVLLVIDGGTGQNALSQTEQFHQAVDVSGIAITKLDGTAKGGILFALARRFGIPIRFIGVGESIGDLRGFQARSFVSALLPDKLD